MEITEGDDSTYAVHRVNKLDSTLDYLNNFLCRINRLSWQFQVRHVDHHQLSNTEIQLHRQQVNHWAHRLNNLFDNTQ